MGLNLRAQPGVIIAAIEERYEALTLGISDRQERRRATAIQYVTLDGLQYLTTSRAIWQEINPIA
ncbi:hypothetical protein O203_11435 [Ectopseudomonas chengduensis]|nr:hypothetical protein O203_11435 [Pseudomonas chengduensis]